MKRILDFRRDQRQLIMTLKVLNLFSLHYKLSLEMWFSCDAYNILPLTLVSYFGIWHSDSHGECNWCDFAMRYSRSNCLECWVQWGLYTDKCILFLMGNYVQRRSSSAVVLYESKYKFGPSVFQQN